MIDESDKSTTGTQPEQSQISEGKEQFPATKAPPNPAMSKGDDVPKDNKITHINESSRTKWELFERGVKIVEFITFIAGIATAAFIGYQWKAMTIASKIADKQLGVMQGQLDEMQKARQDDERAWVAISKPTAMFDMNPSNNERVGVNFLVPFKNTGRTPAINVVPVIGEYFDVNLVPKQDAYPNPVYNSVLLTPDFDWSSTTSHGIESDIFVYQKIRAGSPFYIAGTVWYDDIYRGHHWTQFCFLVNSDFTAISPTAVHNTCDDVQTNQPQQNLPKS